MHKRCSKSSSQSIYEHSITRSSFSRGCSLDFAYYLFGSISAEAHTLNTFPSAFVHTVLHCFWRLPPVSDARSPIYIATRSCALFLSHCIPPYSSPRFFSPSLPPSFILKYPKMYTDVDWHQRDGVRQAIEGKEEVGRSSQEDRQAGEQKGHRDIFVAGQ
jgi:hypothetical protein